MTEFVNDADDDFAREIQKAYLDAILNGKIEILGHGHSVSTDPQVILKEAKEDIGFWGRLFDPRCPFPFLAYASRKSQEEMLKALKEPTNYDFQLKDHHDCEFCGERLFWRTNGAAIYVECYYPNKYNAKSYFGPKTCKYAKTGIPKFIKNQIDVPSGKLLVGNSLHTIFDDNVIFGSNGEVDAYHVNLNNFDGQVQYCNRYAEHGLLTGCIRGRDDTDVKIYADDETLLVYRGKNYNGKLKFIADIHVQLRWYGAADYQKCLDWNAEETEKAIRPEENTLGFPFHNHEYFWVPVKPGRYEMIHHIKKVWYKSTGILSVIKRVA